MAPAYIEMVHPMAQPISAHGKASRDHARQGVDPSSRTPHDHPMENRIANLEKHAAETRDRLIRIETTLEHTATAASVAALEARLVSHVDAGLARVDGDLARLEGRLESGLSSVRCELRQEMAGMKVELLTALSNVRSDLIKWSATMMLAVATLAFTAARFIH